jgi:hypothetical protein
MIFSEFCGLKFMFDNKQLISASLLKKLLMVMLMRKI